MGQISYVSGIAAAPLAAAAVPRIDMTEADRIAMRIPGLKHQIAGRRATGAGAALQVRDRVTGALLVPKGANLANLTTAEVAGHKGITASYASACALALPPGSATESYTAIVALNVSAYTVSASTDYVTNLLYQMADDATAKAIVARLYSAASAGLIGGGLACMGEDALSPRATSAPLPAQDAWAIMGVAFDNDARQIYASIAGTTWAQAAETAEVSNAPTDYVSIGYGLSGSSLRASVLGDLYLFDSCLRTTDVGRAQCAALVSALRAGYGLT